MDTSQHFELCVIGAGSAGLSLVAGAAQLGYSTVLIEKSEMGGDCLNTGCVPSKALLKSGKVAQSFRTSDVFGIKSQEPAIDFAAVKQHVSSVIKVIEPNDSQERFEGLGATVIREEAKFIDENTIQVGEHTITAKYFAICAGARAFIPPIKGIDKDKVYTNENIFDLTERPKHLIIIGGGPIGVEMAQAHQRLGCKVSVIDMYTIMANDDPELVEVVRNNLQNEGVELYENSAVNLITHTPKTVTVHLEKDGSTIDIKGSHLLVATGRQANSDKLDLEKANVEFDRKGIKTDARLRTSQKHIFAAGDIASGPQFTHIAGYHAGIIIRNICFKMPAKVDYSALPWVTYTDPELANVGLTHKEAVEKLGKEKVKTISWPFEENDRAQCEKSTSGLIKVTALANGKILGAGIVGPHAGELIGMWGLAITKDMKLKDITGMIAPYPTFGEINKRVAGAWFTPSLFSDRTRFFVNLLKKLPF